MMYRVECISASPCLRDRQTNDRQERHRQRERCGCLPFHPQAERKESRQEETCALHTGAAATPISTELWMQLRQPRI